MEDERRFYPYIVVGCGGVGSAAVYWLSRRVGADVLGLEQFELGHSNGGSQDHSRIIRLGYHDEIYTKLTRETFKAWREVEEESGIQLVYKTGGVYFTHQKDKDMLDSYANAMDASNIKYDRMKGSELRKRFPQFEIDDSYEAIYETEAGLVDAAMANAVHIQLAQGRGARVIDNCPVKGIKRAPDGTIIVNTAKGVFKCRRLVVTPGAWFNEVLGSVGIHIPLIVTQEQVTYFATPNIKDFTKERFPVWIHHSKERDYYGIPIHGNSDSKIGIDSGGHAVTGDTRTFEPDPVREQICIDYFRRYMPKALGPLRYTKTCLYTHTPDRNFVIDTCAKTGWPDVIICCGASHIFKWASFVGKIVTEMAMDGKTQYDISRFNLDREALTNPHWHPDSDRGSGIGVSKLFSENKSKL